MVAQFSDYESRKLQARSNLEAITSEIFARPTQDHQTYLYASDTIPSKLAELALELQTHYQAEFGDRYSVAELQTALTNWLEDSIDRLVDDALFHTIEGDSRFSFNRREFDKQMTRIKPLSVA